MSKKDKKEQVVEEKSGKMEVASDELISAIKDIKTITGTDKVSLLEHKGMLHVSGSNEGKTLIRMLCNARVDTGFRLSANESVLLGILRAKKVFEFTKSRKDATIKFIALKSKYSGTFAAMPYQDFAVKLESSADKIELTVEAQRCVDTIIKTIRIADVYGGSQLSLHLHIKKNSILGMCFDDLHIAYVLAQVKTGIKDAVLALPMESLDLINKQANSKDYAIEVHDSVLRAFNKDFDIHLPLVQNKTTKKQKLAQEMMESLATTKFAGSVIVSAELLDRALANSLSVYDNGHPLKLSITDKGLGSFIETNFGSVKDFIKGEKAKPHKNEFSVDPTVLRDVTSLVPAKQAVKIGFTDRFLSVTFDHKKFNYAFMCSLTSDKKG